MTPKSPSLFFLVALVVVLGSGCATEIDTGESSPFELTQEALSSDDHDVDELTDEPDCDALRNACRDGNTSKCARYSKRCKVRIGVIGDSLSDEYQGIVSALPGLTWTEQAHHLARISFGRWEDDPSVREEPRNDGHAFNWARFGQAALSLQWSSSEVMSHPNVPPSQKTDPRLQTIGQFDAQIEGLGNQIANGKIDVALVWVGHNDLFIRTFIGYDQDGGQQAFFGALINRIVTAAVTLRSYASADPSDIKAKVAIIGLAGTAAALNPSLAQAAAGAGIPFIDSFNTAVSAIVNEQATTGAYDVAGVDLLPFDIVTTPTFQATPRTASTSDLAFPGTGPCGFNPANNGVGCATPAYAEPFRHYDAVHPNTLYMGAVGNQILTDVNTTFGFALKTLTETRLLDNAGL